MLGKFETEELERLKDNVERLTKIADDPLATLSDEGETLISAVNEILGVAINVATHRN